MYPGQPAHPKKPAKSSQPKSVIDQSADKMYNVLMDKEQIEKQSESKKRKLLKSLNSEEHDWYFDKFKYLKVTNSESICVKRSLFPRDKIKIALSPDILYNIWQFCGCHWFTNHDFSFPIPDPMNPGFFKFLIDPIRAFGKISSLDSRVSLLHYFIIAIQIKEEFWYCDEMKTTRGWKTDEALSHYYGFRYPVVDSKVELICSLN